MTDAELEVEMASVYHQADHDKRIEAALAALSKATPGEWIFSCNPQGVCGQGRKMGDDGAGAFNYEFRDEG